MHVLVILLLLSTTTTTINASKVSKQALLLTEISELRAKELKRRLARQYGYSAEELAKMIDKKDLIQSYAFEQEREFEKKRQEQTRKNIKQSIIMALVVVCITVFWPVLKQAWEAIKVNFVVYRDERKVELNKCLEFKCASATLGMACIIIVDVLKSWLSVSVAASWFVTRNKYFFPTPNIPIRPGAFMEGGGGALSQYGLNVGPMLISWLLSYLTQKLKLWTGKKLKAAYRHSKNIQKQQAKDARKKEALKRAMKDAKRNGWKTAEPSPLFDSKEDDSDLYSPLLDHNSKHISTNSSDIHSPLMEDSVLDHASSHFTNGASHNVDDDEDDIFGTVNQIPIQPLYDPALSSTRDNQEDNYNSYEEESRQGAKIFSENAYKVTSSILEDLD